MMKPEDVKPANFPNPTIIYDNSSFAIAYGNYEDDSKLVLAMRWNGNLDDTRGYPKVFNNPMWFIVHYSLSRTILGSLVGLQEGVVHEKLAEAIKNIDKFKSKENEE